MEIIVLGRYPEINYALVAKMKKDNTVKEFVCAYGYMEETKTWGQGHYFIKIEDAVEFIQSKKVIKC